LLDEGTNRANLVLLFALCVREAEIDAPFFGFGLNGLGIGGAPAAFSADLAEADGNLAFLLFGLLRAASDQQCAGEGQGREQAGQDGSIRLSVSVIRVHTNLHVTVDFSGWLGSRAWKGFLTGFRRSS